VALGAIALARKEYRMSRQALIRLTTCLTLFLPLLACDLLLATGTPTLVPPTAIFSSIPSNLTPTHTATTLAPPSPTIITSVPTLKASVLRVDRIDTLSCGDIEINSHEGSDLLSITVALENSSGTNAELTLTPKNAMVQDGQQREYPLSVVGVLMYGSPFCLYGTGGQMDISPSGDPSWKLTGDFTNNIWIVTIGGGSRMEMLAIYNVPVDASSAFKLFLLDFQPMPVES
jgi:hypothetical protein